MGLSKQMGTKVWHQGRDFIYNDRYLKTYITIKKLESNMWTVSIETTTHIKQTMAYPCDLTFKTERKLRCHLRKKTIWDNSGPATIATSCSRQNRNASSTPSCVIPRHPQKPICQRWWSAAYEHQSKRNQRPHLHPHPNPQPPSTGGSRTSTASSVFKGGQTQLINNIIASSWRGTVSDESQTSDESA